MTAADLGQAATGQAEPEQTEGRAPVDTDRAQVSRVLNRLNGTLMLEMVAMKDYGCTEEYEVAWAQARSRAPTRLVVVGETKRGKSSLVNALAEAGPLSPVGAEETTATYVSLIPTRDPARQNHAEVVMADGSRRPITLAEVATLADLRQKRLADVPVAVDIWVPPSEMGPIILTDTPGVGGLSGSQGELTQRTAADGGALLFVVDAGSPMSQPELNFLDRCAASVESVFVAVTMIDKYPDSAPQMVDHVRQQLRRHSVRAGRFLVFGVSAQVGELARTMPDSPARATLLDYSGLAALTVELRRVAARREVLHSVNALRTCRSAYSRLLRERKAQRILVVTGEPATPELEAQKEKLTQLQASAAHWRLEVERDLGTLRATLVRLITDRLDEVDEKWRLRIEKTPKFGHSDFRTVLGLEMAADYRLLHEDVTSAFVTRLDEMLTSMFDPDPLPAILAALLSAGPDPTPVSVQLTRARPKTLDASLVISGSLGASLGRNIGGIVLGHSALLNPLVVVGAAGWMAYNWVTKSQKLEQQTLMAEYRHHLQAERSRMVEYLDAQLRELRFAILTTYDAHLAARKASVEKNLDLLKASSAGSDGDRRRELAAIDAAMTELVDRMKRVDDEIKAATRLG